MFGHGVITWVRGSKRGVGATPAPWGHQQTLPAKKSLSAIFLEQGWIDEPQHEQWTRMIGFRNLLVHDYLDVGRRVVCEILQEQLDELNDFAAVFAHFL